MGKNGSSILASPLKRLLLKISAEAVRTFNRKRNTSGVTYILKMMIISGVLLKLNGRREEWQLFTHCIIKKYRSECANGSTQKHF